MSTLQQPFKNYNGGKSGNGTYQQIINFIPQCDVFIEAMAGNGGIVCNISLPSSIVINDIDAGIIDAWKDRTDINDYGGHGRNFPELPQSKPSIGAGKIVFEKLHVLDLIDKYDCVGSRKFFYIDPPYLKASRKSQKRLYKYEWELFDHVTFLARIVTVKNNCMISHYPCALYDEMLKGWNRHLFQSTTRHGSAIECIYMNYSKPELLQDFKFLGSDFIQRQRIKRKVSRWLAKLEALPRIESNAIISAVIDKYNYVAGKLIK